MPKNGLSRLRRRWRLCALPLAALLALPMVPVSAAADEAPQGADYREARSTPAPDETRVAAGTAGAVVAAHAPLVPRLVDELARAPLRDVVADKNKSGVSPEVLKLPQSGGSVKGMGETFVPDLNTGTATMSVPIALPPGRRTPSLGLSYSSSGGNGPFGLGWGLGVGAIRRRTDKGLPRYGESDVFLYGDQELVEIAAAGEQLPAAGGRYYRQKNEGSYLRFFRRGAGAGEYWVAQDKDGSEHTFTAGIADGARVFRWNLSRVQDVHGNAIEYHYISDGGQSYLSYVDYNNSTSGAFQHRVQITYGTRPDATTSYVATFPVTTALRATSVSVATDYGSGARQLVRRYDLTYEASRFRSMLRGVQLFGSDGTTSVPPLTFAYTGSDAGEAVAGFGGLDATVHALPGSPPYAIDDARNELLDLDGDGLPDVFFTDLGRTGGKQSYLLNDGGGLCASRPDLADSCALGELDGLGMAREIASPLPLRQITLGNTNVQLLDMDADGQVELLHMPSLTSYSYYRPACGAGGSQRQCTWGAVNPQPIPTNPHLDLTRDALDIRLLDADGDRRIDVVRTSGTRTETYLNQGDGSFGAPLTSCVLHAGGPVMFSDGRVKLADINGDGLTDVVLLRPNAIVYWPNRGHGLWGDGPAQCPENTFGTSRERPLAGSPWFLDAAEMRLGDVNGDGLADLVRVHADAVDIWLNRGNDTFAPKVTLAGMPFQTGLQSHVRFADINGTATPDILWGDASHYRFVDLAGGERPGLLKHYDNGLGKAVVIDYRPSTAFYLDDRALGEEWSDRLPFATPLVHQVTVEDGLGSPPITSRYYYHDGKYDGAEREFRGFRRAEAWSIGDEHSPTSVTVSYFRTGTEMAGGTRLDALKHVRYRSDAYHPGGATRAEDRANAGQRVYKSVAVTSYGLRELYGGQVTQVASTASDTFEYDTNQAVGSSGTTVDLPAYSLTKADSSATEVREDQPLPSAPYVRLGATSAHDVYGNQVSAAALGRAAVDETITATAVFGRNETRWVHRLTESWVSGADEVKLKHLKCAYDGLTVGEVGDRGLQTSCWYQLEGTTTGTVPAHESTYTSWGQPQHVTTAGRSERWLTYADPSGYQTLVSTELVRVGDEGADVTLLASHAEWDPGLGAVLAVTDWNGQRTPVIYDALGRTSAIYKPRAPGKEACTGPSLRLEYSVGAPLSTIHSFASEDDCTPGATLESISFVDGLGRARLSLAEGDAPGEWFASGYATLDAKGAPVDQYAAYRTTSAAYAAPDAECPTGAADMIQRTDTEPTLDWRCPTTTWRDAFGRVTHQRKADRESEVSAEYHPLYVRHFDEEDNDATGPHLDTPTDRWFDGHGRLVAIVRHNTTDGQATLTTQFTINPIGNLLDLVDAAGNHKTQTFDSLGRQIGMQDPNAGDWAFDYDAAGNVVHYRDANGNDLYYGYDPANRLIWERHGSDAPPNDVRYYFDAPYALVGGDGQAPNGHAQNYVLGRLAWVEDASGSRFASYDTRGRQTHDIRYVNGITDPFVSQHVYDDLDRDAARIFPDAEQVSYQYSARGALAAVPGYVSQIDYDALGRPVRRVLADAKATTATRRYDARARLRSYRTEQTSDNTVLLDRKVQLDRVGNVIGIDAGTESGPLASQNVVVGRDNYDALYQLLGVDYTYNGSSSGRAPGERYAYDAAGNLTHMLGTASSGKTGFGTLQQLAGPYQLSAATKPDGSSVAASYDSNGNVLQLDTTDGASGPVTRLDLVWDHNNRLTHVTKSTGPSTSQLTEEAQGDFTYDHAGQRTIKVVTKSSVPAQTIYVAEDLEVRAGSGLTKYIFAGGERVAKVTPNDPVFGAHTYFLHADMLQTTSVVTDEDGALVERTTNLPYGEVEVDANGTGYTDFREPYQFTGQERDEDFGLIYFGARYLSPALGRWMSADPLYLLNPEKCAENLLGCNLYGYANNNPLTLVDALGLEVTGGDKVSSSVDPATGQQIFTVSPIYITENLPQNEWSFDFVRALLPFAIPPSLLDTYRKDYPDPCDNGCQQGMGAVQAQADRTADRFSRTMEHTSFWAEMVGQGGAALVQGGGAAAGLAGSSARLPGGLANAAARSGAANLRAPGAAALERADVAQAAGRRSGTAAELLVGDHVFTDVSTGGASRTLHPGVRKALDQVPPAARSPYHGACAEPGCISKALSAGLDPAGGSSTAVRIRAPGKTAHGTIIPACPSCRAILEAFGIRY